MAAQIGELLDAARMRAGEPLELFRRPTDLVALSYRVAARAQTIATNHAIDVVAEVPELEGDWDALRLERVLGNLLANAVKYSPDGGLVEVRVAREEHGGEPWARLEVRDHGIGIPAADLPHIFEPYRRASNVGVVEGEGLGLAGAKQIVEQHGGTIAVESHEGEGARFTVRLRLAG
jgi:signal transduction histidine kinase